MKPIVEKNSTQHHHDRVGSIHYLGVTGAKPLTNLGNPAVVDEDVGFSEVWGLRPQGEDGASLEESLAGHDQSVGVSDHQLLAWEQRDDLGAVGGDDQLLLDSSS